MSEIIYKQFRGDELLMINPTTYEIKNLYENRFNQKIYGNLIIAKEAGILLDESGNKQLVDIDDIIFVNYDYAFVIKSNELNKAINEQITKRIKRDEERNLCSEACDCEAKTPSN